MFRFGQAKLVGLTIAIVLCFLGNDALFSQGRQSARRTVVLDGREVVEGEVIVRYRSQTGQVERERAEFQADSETSEPLGRPGTRRMRSRHLTTRQLLATLRANPDVEYVEPNYVIRANALPNDPSMNLLWGLVNTGQVVDGQAGTVGADVNAAAAWDIAKGTRSNVVAILDTGLDSSHPDLAANLFTAPRAFSVTVGGVTVDCAAGTHGFNAQNNTCIADDDNGHGTHVAGIVGAVGNNGIGVTGVNWTANLMSLKVLDAAGNGTTADAIKAIDFAIKAKAALGLDANIRVLNASWGGPAFSQSLNDQILAAANADMLFVAAAGSDGNNNDVTPHYPASSTHANVISVAAADNTGALADFSNYGAAAVDLAAPGISTYSTLNNQTYGYLSGTSMAAPFVSGAAALVLSVCPSNTATLKSRLLSGVTPEATMASKMVSGGRLNVYTTLQACLPVLHATISGSTITATVTNSPGYPNDWMALYCPATAQDGGYVTWKYLSNSQTPPASGMTSATVTFPAPTQAGTTCNVRLYSNNAVGRFATSETVTVGSGATPTVSVSSTTPAPGSTINVTVANAPANPNDWLGLFTPSGTMQIDWKYLNGTRTAPATGMSGATVPFTMPTTGGTYEIRLLSNNSYDVLARSSTITISSQPTLTIGDVSVAEGNSGTSLATFTVTLSPVNSSQAVTVNYATADGTATAGSDYLATSGTLNFPANTATRTFTVAIQGDTALENNESFVVNLSAATNALIGDAQATATINNDDAPPGPSVGVSATSVSPGATINVTVANAPGNPNDWLGVFTPDGTMQIDWKYLNGTRTAPATGLSSATVPFTMPTAPGNYEMRLLSNNSYTVIARSSQVTVISQPTLTIGDVTITEGNAGTALATFTVTLSPVNASQSVTVDYATANGSATAGSDYVAASGTLTFPASTATRTFTVSVQGDTTPEGNETFLVNLSNAANAVIGDAQATGTIGNDDAAPTPTVSVGVSSVNNGQPIPVTVTNGPANSNDWVALVNVADPDTAYVDWFYLDGTKTRPTSGVSNASLQFTAPATSGTYDVRFFSSGSMNRLARSTPVNVGPVVTLASSAVAPGAVIASTVSNGPANATDWIALVDVSAADSSYVDWFYLNGTKTKPTTGVSSATVNFTAPATWGTYDVRLFSNNSMTRIARSAPVTVGPYVTVASTTVQAGATISFTVNGGPANRFDWVSISPAAAADTGYLDWKYLSGTKTAPASGMSSASLQFTAPSTPGTYNIRFFADNGMTKLATSATITVSP